MLTPHFLAGLFSVGTLIVGAVEAWGQNYPNRPIRLVTAAVGGGNDYVMRQVTPSVSASIGQPLIVDNRGGAGNIPVELAARSAADGYTLLAHSNSVWVGPLLRKLDYDPIKDFTPIVLVARAPYVLVVHPSVTANSVKDLIALVKANPGKLNYSMTSVGGGAHLASELFKAMAGLNIVRIAYKTSAQEASELIAGQVQMAFSDAGTVSPHIKTGRMKALGVASAQLSPLVPGLPTIASSLPGFEANQLVGLFAPTGTSDAIIRRLNQEFVKVVNLPEVKERLFNGGVEAVGSTPEEFAAIVKGDMAKMAKVIKDANIRVD